MESHVWGNSLQILFNIQFQAQNQPYQISQFGGKFVLVCSQLGARANLPFFAGVCLSVRPLQDGPCSSAKKLLGKGRTNASVNSGAINFSAVAAELGREGGEKRVSVHFSCRGEGTLIQGHTGDGQVGTIFVS